MRRTYIENVVVKFETMFASDLRQFQTPMDDQYHPETDDSPLLDRKMISQFRAFVGSANWVNTHGQFDICYAVQALSRFNMAPRNGHLQAMKRVFGYLKKYNKGWLIVDANFPNHLQYKTQDFDNWKEFYPDTEEDIPSPMPTPRGRPCQLTCYVDADHAHDVVTRRSVTGILLLINNMPIKWISKRQKTVETSTYGSELFAARMAIEAIIEYRYKLQMLGIPVKESAMMLGAT